VSTLIPKCYRPCITRTLNPSLTIGEVVVRAPSVAAPPSADIFDLTAAIVTYRNPMSQLRRAMESIARQQPRIQLVLVDNADESSVADIADEYGAIYLRSPGNIGFGKAHNLAYEHVRQLSSYHLVLNPDVHFDGTVLKTLVDVMAAEPDLGVVMPKILYGNGETQHLCKRLPTPWDLVVRRFAPDFAHGIFRRTMEGYELRGRDYDQPMEPPTLSGCFLLLRNSVIDEVGLFDTRFFMYMEDVDLIRRMLGVSRALYYPHVAITHEYQKGSYRSGRLALHHVLSAVKYFSKWGWLFDQERKRINQRSCDLTTTSVEIKPNR
jgi:GT2 family glycosyltransferase